MRALKRHLIRAHTLLMSLSTPLWLSCGDELRGSAEELTSLATLKVRLSPLEGSSALPSEGSLRLGLVWLTASSPDAWCAVAQGQLFGLPPSSGGAEGFTPHVEVTEALRELTTRVCRDPLGVTPALVGPSVSVSLTQLQEGAELELPLQHLPSAEVLFGTPDARVGYASVVLFEDLDGDGALTLGEAPRISRWGGDDRAREGEPRREADRVYGASFMSLATPHERLVYQEGASLEGLFYPEVGCPERPQGFSVMRSSAELSDLFALLSPLLGGPALTPREGLCERAELSEPLHLKAQAPSSRAQEVLCEPLEDEGEEPPEREPSKELELTCVGAYELLATDPATSCKGVAYWRLVGCPLGEVSCDEPKWDMRTNVPAWWPCELPTNAQEAVSP